MDLSNIEIDIQDDILFLTIRKHLLFLHYGKVGLDAEMLYLHLMFTGKMQKTNTVWATNSYLREGLDWSKDRLQKAMGLLIDLSLCERVNRKDDKGQICGQFIRVNFRQSPMEITEIESENPPAGKPAAGEMTVNALTNNKNALTNNIKTSEKQPSAVAEVRQAFKDAGAKFYFDAKQAKQCKLLHARYKADPDYFLSMIKTFIGLQRTDKWYAKQPCSPAMLNSLWDRIELELRKTPPPSSAAPPPLDDEERARVHRMKLSGHGFDCTKMTDDDALYFSGILDGLKREWMDEWREHIPDHLRRYYVGSPG